MRRAFACGLLALAVLAPARAQDAPTVTLSVEPSEGLIGQVFTATVRVTAPAGVSLVLPGEDADLGEAEVRGLDVEDQAGADSTRTVTLSYALTFWEVGERTVTAPPVAWRTRDGEAQQAERPEATVTIGSVLPEGAQEIKDIRGPREIPLRWWHYGLAALPVLLFGGLVALGVRWLVRRRTVEQAEASTPPLSAHEEALRALDELAAEDLPGRERVEEHYVRLSWIVRRYAERRWELPALEATTGMLAQIMHGSGRVPAEAGGAIVALLRRADLAKFAKHRPASDVAREDVAGAREVVRRTRPAPPVEVTEAGEFASQQPAASGEPGESGGEG